MSNKRDLSFISDTEIERAIESITLVDVHRIIKLADRIFCLTVNEGPHTGCMEDLEVELAGDSEIKRIANAIAYPHEGNEIEAAGTVGTMILAATLLAARHRRKGKSVHTHRMMRRSVSTSKAAHA